MNKTEGLRYYSRAWNYQDYMFASRRLVFGRDRTMRWECSQITWFECVEEEFGCKPASKFHLEQTQSAHYRHLVREYSARDVTYGEDIHPAFRGAASTLPKSLGRMISALPRYISIWLCIGWSTIAGHQRSRPLPRHEELV